MFDNNGHIHVYRPRAEADNLLGSVFVYINIHVQLFYYLQACKRSNKEIKTLESPQYIPLFSRILSYNIKENGLILPEIEPFRDEIYICFLYLREWRIFNQKRKRKSGHHLVPFLSEGFNIKRNMRNVKIANEQIMRAVFGFRMLQFLIFAYFVLMHDL